MSFCSSTCLDYTSNPSIHKLHSSRSQLRWSLLHTTMPSHVTLANANLATDTSPFYAHYCYHLCNCLICYFYHSQPPRNHLGSCCHNASPPSLPTTLVSFVALTHATLCQHAVSSKRLQDAAKRLQDAAKTHKPHLRAQLCILLARIITPLCTVIALVNHLSII